VEVYPNPAEEVINISAASEQIIEVSLFNGDGKQVLDRKVRTDRVNVAHLPPGVYNMVVYFISGKRLNKRVVVF